MRSKTKFGALLIAAVALILILHNPHAATTTTISADPPSPVQYLYYISSPGTYYAPIASNGVVGKWVATQSPPNAHENGA